MSSFNKLAVVLLATAVFMGLGGAGAQATIYPSPTDDLALASNGGVASASGVWSADYFPVKAIDGNRSGNGADGSINHTTQNWDPWLQVQLPTASAISSVIVFNRTDALASYDALDPFRVEVFNGTDLQWTSGSTALFTPDITIGTYPVEHARAGSPVVEGQTFTVPAGVTGDIVKVTMISGWSYLHLAEVEVYGVPEPSTLVLLASGLIGLLAYAWRKRR